MPRDPASTLAGLLRSVTIDDHEEILKAANAALKADKRDELAQRTRVVALLKLDRFDDVSRAISEGGLKLENECALENAYALYKSGRLEEATRALSTAGIKKRSFGHVAAQVAYRAERFDEALSIYHQLLDADPLEERNDLNINIKAVQSQAWWTDTASYKDDPDHEKAFETLELCFNAACLCIAQGALDTASKLLQRALTLCDASDELTEEDKAEERKPIVAQQALLLAKSGELDHARGIFKQLGTDAQIDADLKIIAQNNYRTLNQTMCNPFELEQEAAGWRSLIPQAKLFSFQSRILNRNCLVADLQAHKLNGVKARVYKAKQQAQLPSPDANVNSLSVIGAAAATQGLSGKDLERALHVLFKKHPNDAGLALTITQLCLQRQNVGAALHVLETFFSRLESARNEESLLVRFSPGLVALAVSLKRIQKGDSSARLELAKAAEFWQSRPAGTVTTLLTEAGIELASSSSKGDLELASATFAKLNPEKQASAIARAGLVAANAATDTKSVEQYVADLPSVKSLIHGIDLAALIDAGVVSSSRSTASKKRSAAHDATVERPAKKRNRKRLPKGFAEGQKPDPERWLPLRDRSTYRPKGKKGRKKAAESTQGGMVKDQETLGLVGGGGVKVEKASAGPSKKKKKGKK